MNPYAALIGAIIGGADEATTGKERQTNDAILKAAAFRAGAYDKRGQVQPNAYNVHQSDVLGGAMAGAGAATGLGMGAAKANKDQASANFLSAPYDMGGMESGKMNGQNLDLSGNATGASGYQREGSNLQLMDQNGLSGDRRASPYRKLSLMNGYNF